ncbi:DUF6959 family protein [Streptomyces incanus]|uniref:DUF6959 family protein n=1 Tax=Streptomyces incanus TaxID=887453 RepID=A0ABW0XP93_9ACTN
MPWFARRVDGSPGSRCRATLFTPRGDVVEVAEACARGDVDEAQDCAGLLLANLDALLTRYEAALDEHEIPRPY